MRVLVMIGYSFSVLWWQWNNLFWVCIALCSMQYAWTWCLQFILIGFIFALEYAHSSFLPSLPHDIASVCFCLSLSAFAQFHRLSNTSFVPITNFNYVLIFYSASVGDISIFNIRTFVCPTCATKKVFLQFALYYPTIWAFLFSHGNSMTAIQY